MAPVDKRPRLSRRDFLATGAAAALVIGAGSIAAPSGAWSIELKALRPETMATLILMAHDTYPHDRLGDQAYARVLEPYDAAAAKDDKLKGLLESGVINLDVRATKDYYVPYNKVPWQQERVALLKSIEESAFFQKIRGDLVTGLYNNKAYWAEFGYEGESASKGGYLKRGFNDLDWL